MNEFVLNEKDIEYLKKALYSAKSYSEKNIPKESIMTYESECSCDDGFLCEHRLEWLINYIESKKLRTRKTKLNKINNEIPLV